MVDRQKIIQIFKASPTPTSIVSADDPEFTFVQMNDAYLDMTERNAEDLIGRSIFKMFPANPDEAKPTGPDRLLASFRRVLKTKKADEMNDIRYDITLKDGTYREYYWRVVNVPVFDEEGSVEFIINSATNITEQRLNEREYKLMLNNAEDSFVLIDRERKVLNFNEAYAEKTRDIFGKDPEVGMSIMEFALPERVDKVNDILEKVFNGEIVKADLEMTNTEGRDRYFYTTYRPAILENGAIYGALFSVYEKTKEYDTKKELEISEARYRALVENGNDVLFILSPEAKPTYISPSLKNVLGYSQEEAYEMDLMKIVHPDDQSIVVSELEKCLSKPGEPIEVTPARMKHKDGRYRWFEATITNMLHDPAINGIVDNFRDITDRVEYQEKIAETKQQYQSLIQTIDGIVWEADAQSFIFNYVSPQTEEILGYSADQWVGEKEFWQSIIHPEDRNEAVEYCHYKTQEGLNHSFEYRIKHKDGHYIWIRDLVTVISVDGIPKSMRGLMIDITQQKELEQKLQQAYLMAKIGAWELDLIKEKLNWSKYVKELHEVEPDYKPGLDTAIKFYKEGWSRDKIQEAVEKAISEGEQFDLELIIVTAKGTERWVRVVGKPEILNGECVRLFGSTQDITERKITQIELQETENKFRNVVEHSTNMFYQHDVHGILSYVSPQSMNFLGHSPEDAKRNWQEFITDHPINKEGEKLTQKALETGEIQEPYELQLITKDNRIIWVEVHEAPLVEDNEVVGIVGSLTDITDRKKYEKQLKQSLERYDYVSKASRDAIYDWDITNNTLHWGEGFKTLFGHRSGIEKHPLKNWSKMVHSDDVEEAMRNLEFTLEDSSLDSWSSEYRFKKAQGGYAYVSENGYIIRNEDGKAIRMIGALRDVTEAKKSEIQNEIQRNVAHFFKEQENLDAILRKVLRYLVDYGRFETAEIWLKSSSYKHQILTAAYSREKKGQIFYDNSRDIQQFIKGEGLPGTVWESKDIEIWDNIDEKTSFIRRHAAKKAGIKSGFGIPLFHKEEFTGVLLLSSSGDIAANKQTLELFEGLQEFLGAEIKRKQQEEEFKLLFDSAPEILAIATPNGYFSKVNQAFSELLGYSVEELVSQPFENFLHPDDRNKTLDEYNETKTGVRQTENFVNRYLTKSGETVYMSWYSSDIFGEDGLFFAYGRDVTERVELENLLHLTNQLAKVGSWELDLNENNEDQTVYWSGMTREIFEVSDDYDPNLSNDLDFFKPSSRKILINAVEKASQEGTPYDLELEIISAEGNSKWVRCIGSAEFINGICKRLFGSIQDITEKKTAEIEFEKAFKEKETILESIGDAFFAIDHDWTVTYWNKEAENVLEKLREEVVGKNLWTTFEDTKDLKFFNQYHKAVDEQVTVNFEEYYPRAKKWFEVSAYPNQNGLSVFFKDVTEKKAIQQEIKETNEKLKVAQEIAKLGYWELKIDTNELFWSDEVYRIWELKEQSEPLTFEKFRETIHPDDVDEFDKQQKKAITGNEELNFEHRIILRDNTIKWVHEIGNTSTDKNGNIISFQGTVQDITARKKAKIEVENTLKEKETILESIEDGFFTLNKNWIVTYWNRAAERMLHTPKQDILGQNLWDVFAEAVDLPSYTNYHRAMHQKINVDFEDYWSNLGKWFDISAYPSPDGISVFFKDITERKKANEKLEELNTELKQRADELAASNEELEQFAYVASHDLQEPLRMVTSFLTQLDKKYGDNLDQKANEYIHYAVDGAQRMRQIILDLLNYSRLNKDQAKREKVSLNKLLDDAKSLERSHIQETNAEIICDKLPTLKVNPGAVQQVFQNLLNNAIKYQKADVTPKIKISAEELDSHWKISFSDNGIGINEEFKDTIFQIFQRLHTRDHYSGTGIGLAISKKIIERHQGKIWVESEEGKGSTFYFTLKK